MNWKTMPKQKRDLMILGVILGVGALVLVYMYLLTPWIHQRAARIQEQATLTDHINKAKKLRGNLNSLRIKKLREELQTLGPDLKRLLPPQENSFLWANGWLDQAVRAAGLTLDTVNEITMTNVDWVQSPAPADKTPAPPADIKQAPPAKKKRCGPYRISCSISGDFRDIVAMVESLQSENPYLSIVKLDVVGASPDPLKQRAELIIEWPRHAGPYDKKLAEFLLEKPAGGSQPL